MDVTLNTENHSTFEKPVSLTHCNIKFFILFLILTRYFKILEGEKLSDHAVYRNSFFSSSSHIYCFLLFTHPQLGLTPPGTYNPNARVSDACRGCNSLWTRTVDRYTRAGLPECVVSTMSGPPAKTT